MMNGEWKDTYSDDEKEIVDCPQCGKRDCAEFAKEWSLSMVRCNNCGLSYVSPRPKDNQMHYQIRDRDFLMNKYADIYYGRKAHPRDPNYAENIRMIQRVKPEGKLLDVGTHCGWFLRKAKLHKWDTMGIEPATNLAEAAREFFGLNIVNSYLEADSFPENTFDVVTVIDVLEHLAEPHKYLGIIHNILKPDGVIFIKTPHVKWNTLKYKMLVSTLKRKNMDIYDAREHIIQYEQQSLEKMLNSEGFNVLFFYVPLPIQSGSSVSRAIRTMSYNVAKTSFRVTSQLSPLCTDVACLARVNKT